MKKILLTAFILGSFSLIGINAAEFSFSDSGVSLNGNITRNGSNVIMKYKIDGMNNIKNLPNIPNESMEMVQAFTTIDMTVEASCTEPKIRMLALTIIGVDGKVINVPTEPNWDYLSKPEEIQSIKNICERY